MLVQQSAVGILKQEVFCPRITLDTHYYMYVCMCMCLYVCTCVVCLSVCLSVRSYITVGEVNVQLHDLVSRSRGIFI